jgi:hypothetical protein
VKRSALKLLCAFAVTLSIFGQAPPVPAPVIRSGKQGALADFTGYWVSLVTEDWRYRMVTPPKGDANGLPLTAEARTAMNAWDPAKDEAAGEPCKAYGAPGLMRRPTRLHITWQDDNTLKIETDEGTQTRLLHFNSQLPDKEPPSLQGYSAAIWEGGPGRGGPGGGGAPVGIGVGGGAARGGPAAPAGPGSLKVVTTNLKPGYLRTNGVPYDSNTTLTEFFTKVSDPTGEEFLIVTSAVEDPRYIRGDYLTSTHYLKERDGSKWDPSPCRVK